MFFSCQVNQVCLAYILVVALLGCVEWYGILVYYDRIPTRHWKVVLVTDRLHFSFF